MNNKTTPALRATSPKEGNEPRPGGINSTPTEGCQTKSDGVVPRYRFPGFDGEWGTELFEKIYLFKSTNSLSREKLNYKQGTVKNIHYGDIHTKFSTLFDIEKENVPYMNPAESVDKIKPDSYCVEGDLIFADASEDTADIGKCIEIISLNNEKLVSGLHTLLARQIKRKLFTGFGGYLFSSNRIREQIKRESQGSKVLGLSGGRFSSISVTYPADEKEQTKIADCLTSLDEVITAQTQKLDALKAHKKGLMQGLFPYHPGSASHPSEGGEWIPRLRFPGFDGEWVEKKLGEICSDISSGKDKIYSNGEYDLYGSTGIIGKTQKMSYRGRYILIARVGANAGLLTLANGQFGVTDNTLVVFLVESENLLFIYYYLENINLNKLVFGSGQPLITGGQLKALALYRPEPEEQQRIADCLSSLDELIAAQSQKIDALKLQKKGLMQGLFPAGEDHPGSTSHPSKGGE